MLCFVIDHYLFELLMPVAMFGTLFLGIVSVIRAVNDFRLRSKLINLGYTEEEKAWLLKKYSEKKQKLATLKWGVMLSFVGIGMMLLEFLPFAENSPFTYGFVGLSAGLGFLTYFFLTLLYSKNVGEE